MNDLLIRRTVCDTPGYQSWPMIHSVGGRLVCAWSRGTAHDIRESVRHVRAAVSDDGGITWTGETTVVNTPGAADVAEGKGSDSAGAMLLWIRTWGNTVPAAQQLFRTEDGKTFERISRPALDPMPMQITDIFPLPGGKLMCLWFAGFYRGDNHNSWGTLTSSDDGRTWTQNVVEQELSQTDWPTEPSVFHAGNGRLFGIARTEWGKAQFQLQSEDCGVTWKRFRTNIGDIALATPSLIFHPESRLIDHYYFQRGAGLLKKRTVSLDEIWNNPEAWPPPRILAECSTAEHHAGNVNASRMNGKTVLAWYEGDPANTAVFMAQDDL